MSDYESLQLNEWSASVADEFLVNAGVLGCELHDIAGAQVVDCGVAAKGSLEAGQLLSLACLADLADIECVLDRLEGRLLPKVTVSVNEPAVACLFSQYAGWKVTGEGFFAMGSGPMRAIRGKEEIFEELGYHEEATTSRWGSWRRLSFPGRGSSARWPRNWGSILIRFFSWWQGQRAWRGATRSSHAVWNLACTNCTH